MSDSHHPVRYAVIGLGHIAQAAVLPAFANASRNSRLTALVSGDPTKLKKLGRKYKATNCYSYSQYDDCLKSGQIDAVYIALPNHMHAEYAVRAAEAGCHILCEKPMAVTEDECLKMMHAAETSRVRLMIAYRLHFEAANLAAAEMARSGQLGELRYFSSSFSMQVKPGNVRLDSEKGGGTLYDIGIYCINAARSLFRSEPEEATALQCSSGDPRFSEVDEMTSAVLRFPENRLAVFTSSFGAADVSSYRLVGTEGDLRVEPAYEYQGKLATFLTLQGNTSRQAFRKSDQFAPELLYFSDCIQQGQTPEPAGQEGLADVRIIEALYQSAREGRTVRLPAWAKAAYPHPAQGIYRPPAPEPELVHAESPVE